MFSNMIRAQDTLELLADLVKTSLNEEYIDAVAFRILATRLINEEAVSGVDARTNPNKKSHQESADYIAMGVAAVSRLATPYYCDPEMSAVIEASAKVMDTTDITDTTLIPAKYGFCYFARGITISDGMIMHGMLWAEVPKNPGVYWVYGFNDRLNEADGSTYSWDQYMEHHQVKSAIKTTRWIYRFQVQYADGEKLSLVTPEEREKVAKTTSEKYNMGTITLEPRQVFHALMLMLNQPPEVIQISKTEATKKKAARLKEKKMPTEVTVVNLRRKYATTASGYHEPSDREYSHRWVVNGFWRWQQYKKEKGGEWLRKRIWIDSYVKGPADKPLHITDKVYALLK